MTTPNPPTPGSGTALATSPRETPNPAGFSTRAAAHTARSPAPTPQTETPPANTPPRA